MKWVLHTGEVVEGGWWDLVQKIREDFGIESVAKYSSLNYFDADPSFRDGDRGALGGWIAARQAEVHDDSADFYAAVSKLPIIGQASTYIAENIADFLGSDQKDVNERLRREEELAKRNVPAITGATVQRDEASRSGLAWASHGTAPELNPKPRVPSSPPVVAKRDPIVPIALAAALSLVAR